MVGASFNNIGSQGMCLKDLAPTGYLTAPWFLDEDQGGCFGEFVVKVLDQSGGTALDENGKEKNYAYYHTYDYDGGEWENDACWKQGSTKILDDSVKFDPGEGLWFYVAASAYSMGFKGAFALNNAGEAMLKSGSVELRSGSKGVVATLSAAVDLANIKPIGYLEAPWFLDEDQGGCFGEFVVKVLDQSGGTALDENGKEKNYAYYHTYDYDGGEWENDACWKQGSTKITKGAVTFEMGEGLWAYVAASAYTMGFKGKYYLEFPGLED